jgi:hypothetical protein
MNDWKELSRLPREPEYWSALQQRVTEQARPQRDSWLQAAAWTSAIATAATIALVLLRPDTQPGVQFGLAPNDPVGVELLATPQPPEIGAVYSTYIANR